MNFLEGKLPPPADQLLPIEMGKKGAKLAPGFFKKPTMIDFGQSSQLFFNSAKIKNGVRMMNGGRLLQSISSVFAVFSLLLGLSYNNKIAPTLNCQFKWDILVIFKPICWSDAWWWCAEFFKLLWHLWRVEKRSILSPSWNLGCHNFSCIVFSPHLSLRKRLVHVLKVQKKGRESVVCKPTKMCGVEGGNAPSSVQCLLGWAVLYGRQRSVIELMTNKDNRGH